MLPSALVDKLKSVLGPRGLLQGNEIADKYCTDLFNTRRATPSLIMLPKATVEVSKVIALCHEHDQAIVVQGGMTGLVDAAIPLDDEIVLSLERMRTITDVDEIAGTMTAQAGVRLQEVQERAEEHNFFFPLDLGARGSCTIGGNLATNAGGNRVIRYGMMRDLTLGVEAVLADGTIIDSRIKTIKNNTGYDLRQLFVGSEGTLGVITSAVLRLYEKPLSQCVSFCALNSFHAVTEFLHFANSRFSGTLSAFEVLWSNAYDAVQERVPSLTFPLKPKYSHYVLLECMGGDLSNDEAHFETVLAEALEKGLILDAVLARSKAEVASIWAIRDGIPEALLTLRPVINYDVSIPLADMDKMARRVSAEFDSAFASHRTIYFGHIGDGNLHISTTFGAETRDLQRLADEIVYGLTKQFQGSISAEHGIGFSRRAYLQNTRSAHEIDLMKTIKKAMDPNNILNPGRVFEFGPAGQNN